MVVAKKFLLWHYRAISHTPVQAFPFGLSTVPVEFTIVARGQTDGFAEGYKDPSVPRQLVGLDRILSNLSPACTNSGNYLSGPRLARQHGKSELDPKQVFDLIGYQFDLKDGKVRSTLDQWQTLTANIQELLTGWLNLCHQYQTSWPGQSMHLACHGRIWTHMPSHQQPSRPKWWRSCRTTHAG